MDGTNLNCFLCPRCGRGHATNMPCPDPLRNLKEDMIYSKPINETGWECPKCGRIYSPSNPECQNCNNR